MNTVANSMFFNDNRLTTVILPKNVTYIGDTAFHSTGLSKITLPASLTSMGSSVFVGCTSLTAFTVEEGNSVYKSVNGVLFSADGTTLLCYPAGKMGTYSIPEGTKYIATSAFRSARYLYSVTFPSTLVEIGDYSFSYCTDLNYITFPENITRICDSAFRSCTNLYDITFENDSVILESGGVFAECDSLVSITLPAKISEIPGYLFYGCAKLRNVTIPDTAQKIGSSAFLDCDSLVRITVPGSVKSIGQQAFDFCNKLETIVLEEGLQSLGWICIRNAPSLKKVVLPSSLTHIEHPSNASSYMFEECPNLTLYVNCESFAYSYAVSRGLRYQLSHPTTAQVTAPTCTEEGYTHYSCACGLTDYISDYVPAAGHIGDAEIQEPTCTEPGYAPDVFCIVCGIQMYEAGEIPALGHTEVVDAAVAPTCTTTGLTEGRRCLDCGEILVPPRNYSCAGSLFLQPQLHPLRSGLRRVCTRNPVYYPGHQHLSGKCPSLRQQSESDLGSYV